MGKADSFKTLCVKFNKNSSVSHQLFIKQHKTREESHDRPSELTLFVGNVPPYYNEEALRRLFQSFGPVRSIYFADISSPSQIVTLSKRQSRRWSLFDESGEIKGYKVAYIVFYSAKDLEKVLRWQEEEPFVLTDDEFSIVTGLREYYEEYNDNLTNVKELQEEIDQFMATYDTKMKENPENEDPDEEGWVTISKKGRNPGFARKQSVKNNIIKKITKKRRRKQLMNFYTFQIKESKMNHLCALKKKMEQDKKKIELLKARRMFKPF